ncbi:hypothetical protein STEG23_013952 [Scotinomys teguina]
MGSGWSSEEEERQPLLGPGLGPAPGAARRNREAAAVLPAAGPGPGRVYGRRWLVLLLFSLLAFAQGLVWNTWGPIQNSARQAYSFSGLDIALLVLWGPIGFLPCFAFMWLLDKKGLRITVLLTSLLVVLGTGLRCIPVSDLTLKKRLIHGGQILNGLAGPTVMNAAPFLSTTWFSADERATATAIASMLSYLGGACAFLVGPLVVPAPNGTSPLLTAESSRAHIKDRIETVLYAEFGVVCLIFSATLAYFPPRPPLPPSVAAASQRLSYRRSFCRLLSNVRFLMIALAYAIPLGVFAGWSGVLDLILTPVHVSQVDAGWIGFWSIVGGCVVGIAMARFADFIRGMLKLILLLLFSGATLSSTWFTLTCLNTITHLPLTTVSGGSCGNGSIGKVPVGRHQDLRSDPITCIKWGSLEFLHVLLWISAVWNRTSVCSASASDPGSRSHFHTEVSVCETLRKHHHECLVTTVIHKTVQLPSSVEGQVFSVT